MHIDMIRARMESAEYTDALIMRNFTRTNYGMVVRACAGFSADEFCEFVQTYPMAGKLHFTRPVPHRDTEHRE